MFEFLSEFSQTVSGQVASAFPEWIGRARVEEDAHGERAFVLAIDPPSRNVAHALRIDTFRDEVTISFDSHHEHFDDFFDGTPHDAFTLVRSLVSGAKVAVSYWRNDEWCGSTLLEERNIPVSNDEHPYANLIKVRCWSGAIDDDISCTPRG